MNSRQNQTLTKCTAKSITAKAKRKRKQALNSTSPIPTTPSDYAFSIVKTAVSQICKSSGFKRTELHALETLTDITAQYLQTIAKFATSFSNASSRTDSNLFDLINAIHDLYLVQGFPGGSRLHKNKLLRSPALKEIVEFVKHSDEVPFAKPILQSNSSIPSSTNTHTESSSRCSHIPRWLPVFPEESSFKDSEASSSMQRKCGEKFWEDSLFTESHGVTLKGNKNAVCGREVKKEGKAELAMERGKVRFRIGKAKEKMVGLGVNMRYGICKGGKRVCWDYSKTNEEDEGKCVIEGGGIRNEIKRGKMGFGME